MSDDALDFAGLLKLLSFATGEYVSVGYEIIGKKPWHTAVMDPADAPGYVAGLSTEAEIYFGVCPTRGPARDGAGRGTEAAVTRLSSLWADLDVKPGACVSLDVAHTIIGDLTAAIGTRPSAIVHSGGGLHPYWVVADGWINDGDIGPARALVKRWGRLVTRVANDHGAQVDNVFELARMLRVPGTFNNKKAA